MELVNCDFCGSSNYRPKYQVRTSKYHPDYLQAISIVGPNPPESFTVVECRDCGLMFLNPRYSARELKEAYPDEQYSDRSGFFSGSILLKRSGAIPEIKFRGETVDDKTYLPTILLNEAWSQDTPFVIETNIIGDGRYEQIIRRRKHVTE